MADQDQQGGAVTPFPTARAALMRARPDARGCVELKGEIWYLRRRREPRIPLGRKSALRTKAAARAQADEWIARTRFDEIVPGPQLPAVEYFERFIRLRLPLMRQTTQAVYRSVIRKHLEPAIAGRKLIELDTAWFTEFIATRATMERATLMNLRRVALQILRQAVRDGFGACRIVTADVRLPRNAKPAKPQRFFTADELERILAAAPFPWKVVYALMGYAGLRAGEALGLRYGDIDAERRIIKIRQNAVRGKLGAPKTETSTADVPLLPALAAVLADYAAWVTDQRVTPPEALVVQTRNGSPYQADDIRRYRLQPLLRRLGIAKAGLHAFRHSVPRMLHARGVSVAVISKVMRHASIQQTETYLHTRAEDLWANLAAAGLVPPQTSADVAEGSPNSSARAEISGAPT